MKKDVQTLIEEQFPEFEAEISALSEQELNNRLAQLSKDLEESETSKEADEEYQNTKALARQLSEPYREIKKAIRLKSKYIIKLVKEKSGK